MQHCDGIREVGEQGLKNAASCSEIKACRAAHPGFWCRPNLHLQLDVGQHFSFRFTVTGVQMSNVLQCDMNKKLGCVRFKGLKRAEKPFLTCFFLPFSSFFYPYFPLCSHCCVGSRSKRLPKQRVSKHTSPLVSRGGQPTLGAVCTAFPDTNGVRA